MISFKVQCHPDGEEYLNVRIYRTKRQMKRFLVRVGWRSDCEACCCGYKRQQFFKGRWRTLPDLGTLVFHDSQFRVGVIAHECGHAALRWWERKSGRGTLRIDSQDDGMCTEEEESVLWVAGNLVAQVATGYQERVKTPTHPKTSRPVSS